MSAFLYLIYSIACGVGSRIMYGHRNAMSFDLQEMKLIEMFDALTTAQKILRAAGYIIKGLFEAFFVIYGVASLGFLVMAVLEMMK